MSYLVAFHSDRGISKQYNQDSLCVKEAQTVLGEILMAVICDGMGGLEKGELASASVILAFSHWFDEELKKQILLPDYLEDIKIRWEEILKSQNETISEYGKENDIQLGTTVTALLIINEETYIIAHIGDTRVYGIDSENIEQLTEDQTVVASEIKAGRLTPEQAEVDPRRSVLLQCVGASVNIQTAMQEEKIGSKKEFLLCTDGFRHEISSQEIHEKLQPKQMENEVLMKKALEELTELNKEREETDNISSILIKIV